MDALKILSRTQLSLAVPDCPVGHKLAKCDNLLSCRRKKFKVDSFEPPAIPRALQRAEKAPVSYK